MKINTIMKKYLIFTVAVFFTTLPLIAQNFGRYANGTAPGSIVNPTVSYTKELEKSAKKDTDGSLVLQLADCYMYGLGVKENEKKAIKLYTEAVEKYSNNEAMLVLADYYIQHEDIELAYNYYQQAANSGYAPAQVIFGDMLQMYARKQNISKFDATIKKLESDRLPYDPKAYRDTLSALEGRLKNEYDELYKASFDPNHIGVRIHTYDEKMNELSQRRQQVVKKLESIYRQSQTSEMKRQYDIYTAKIESIEVAKQSEQEFYEWMKSSLDFRSKIVGLITEEKDYLTYYKKSADQNYPEGMYAYAYFAKDYDYMPIAAEAGSYSLYTDLTEHYYTKILDNEDVLASYSLMKKYSDLAEQHREGNRKDLVAYIESNSPEQLISEAKMYVEINKSIQNDMLVAMNYALYVANDTAKLNVLLLQMTFSRFQKQHEQILNTLYSTMDKVNGSEKIKFCQVNVNNSFYTNLIHKCLNHIVTTDQEGSTLAEAWYMLGNMAYDGQIADINTKELKEQKRFEYYKKALYYGKKSVYDYVTRIELDNEYHFSEQYYRELKYKEKNDFNIWNPEVVACCQYWMLFGDTIACLDYAQVLLDNHEGAFTAVFDSTINDAYQRAINKGCKTARVKQMSYNYLFAGGYGMESVYDEIKANGNPIEQIKLAQALLDMGDDGGKAMKVLQLALDANSADAYYQLYKWFYDERVKNEDVHNYEKAFVAFEKAIELGKTDKIPEIAEAYIYGINHQGRDEHKAVTWVKKGHELGIKKCTEQLAWCYARGLDNTPIDFNKAQELMKAAGGHHDFSYEKQQYQLVKDANNNNIEAIRRLISDYDYKAESYEKSTYSTPTITNAERFNNEYRREQMKWIKKGVALGDAESIRKLGWAYYYGWAGLKVDKNLTLKYLKQAAAKKNSNANYNLGWCYEYGMDGFITPNRRVAAEYYRAAYNYGGGKDCERAWLRCIN